MALDLKNLFCLCKAPVDSLESTDCMSCGHKIMSSTEKKLVDEIESIRSKLDEKRSLLHTVCEGLRVERDDLNNQLEDLKLEFHNLDHEYFQIKLSEKKLRERVNTLRRDLQWFATKDIHGWFAREALSKDDELENG